MIVVEILLPGVAQADRSAIAVIAQTIKTPAAVSFDFLLNMVTSFFLITCTAVFLPFEHRMALCPFCTPKRDQSDMHFLLFCKVICDTMTGHRFGAQTNRRDGAGPAGACLPVGPRQPLFFLFNFDIPPPIRCISRGSFLLLPG